MRAGSAPGERTAPPSAAATAGSNTPLTRSRLDAGALAEASPARSSGKWVMTAAPMPNTANATPSATALGDACGDRGSSRAASEHHQSKHKAANSVYQPPISCSAQCWSAAEEHCHGMKMLLKCAPPTSATRKLSASSDGARNCFGLSCWACARYCCTNRRRRVGGAVWRAASMGTTLPVLAPRSKA